MDHTLDNELELRNDVTVDEIKYIILTDKLEVRHSWINKHDDVFVYATMFFKKDNPLSLEEQEPFFFKKYVTYEEAKEGHQETLSNIEEIIRKIKKDREKA